MKNNGNSKNVTTCIPMDVFNALENKRKQTGMSRSAYLKSVIYADLNMDDSKILKKQEKESEGILSKLQRVFKKTNPISEPKEEANSEPKLDKIHHLRWNNKVETNKWMMGTTGMKEFVSLKLTKTGQIDIPPYHTSKFDINEWYVIRDLALTDDFLVRDFKELCQFLGVNSQAEKKTLSQAIWNIWLGKFDEINNTIESSICSLNYTVDENMLCINNEPQNVTVNEIREILGCLNQKFYSERAVLTLSKSYNHMDPLLFRIICMNYNNSDFTRLLKKDARDFVENNPSKRRNIIRLMGGGI